MRYCQLQLTYNDGLETQSQPESVFGGQLPKCIELTRMRKFPEIEDGGHILFKTLKIFDWVPVELSSDQ